MRGLAALGAFLAGVSVILLAGAAIVAFTPKPATTECGQHCYQAVASADWYGFHELDCDDMDAAYGFNQTCTDEMQNINVAPVIESVKRTKQGWTVVRIVVAEKSGNRSKMDVTLNGRNEVVRAVPVAS